jgi:hypothetical protein
MQLLDQKGLKATSIDLDAVAGIRYLAENADTYEKYPHLLRNAIGKTRFTISS